MLIGDAVGWSVTFLAVLACVVALRGEAQLAFVPAWNRRRIQIGLVLSSAAALGMLIRDLQFALLPKLNAAWPTLEWPLWAGVVAGLSALTLVLPVWIRGQR